MDHVKPAAALAATLAVLGISLPSSAVAGRAPQSDRTRDATGDVVRTYAGGTTVTGPGRSDIHWVTLARTASPGGSGPRRTAATVSVRLTNIDRVLQHREVRLIVHWVTDRGHDARTTTYFGGPHGGQTYVVGLPTDDCVPYPGVHPRRDVLSIALANDRQCWPGASSLHARVWVRYRFSEHGVARDASPHVGPVAVPAAAR